MLINEGKQDNTVKWDILKNEYFYFWYFKYIPMTHLNHFYSITFLNSIVTMATYFYTLACRLLLKSKTWLLLPPLYVSQLHMWLLQHNNQVFKANIAAAFRCITWVKCVFKAVSFHVIIGEGSSCRAAVLQKKSLAKKICEKKGSRLGNLESCLNKHDQTGLIRKPYLNECQNYEFIFCPGSFIMCSGVLTAKHCKKYILFKCK